MGLFPVKLISALSADFQREVGWSYDQLKALPAIPPDADHRLASAVSLARSLTKKFLPSNTTEQDAACLSKFLSVNTAAETWSLCLNTSLDEELWGTFKDELYGFFYPNNGVDPLILSLDHIFLQGKCGPGAGIGALNGDFYSKMFSSSLTTTSQGLVDNYMSNIRRYPEWFLGEEFRSTHFQAPRIVQGSRLSFVPKNDSISRSICTEPTLNMFYQLGLGRILEKRLRSHFKVDLSLQPAINASRARSGSVNGSWSTIDLESASDSIGVKMLQEALPPLVLSYFMLLRSPRTTIGRNTHELSMISSMGNGFTFPLQTVIFSCAVRAVYRSYEYRQVNPVHVFGDDIVIPSCMDGRLRNLLRILGFVVNPSKSFNKGPFRESCGFDFFAGKNIRGVYVKRWESVHDSYACINALNQFSARTGLKLTNAVLWLLGRVDQSLMIPPWENPSGGIQVPLRLMHTKRVSEKTQGTLYTVYEFKARKVRIDEKMGRLPNGKRLIYNPSGLLIAFLAGMALSSGLPLREQGKWRKKRRSCSYWDSFGPDPLLLRGFGWQRWETAVWYNTLLSI